MKKREFELCGSVRKYTEKNKFTFQYGRFSEVVNSVSSRWWTTEPPASLGNGLGWLKAEIWG